MAASIELGHSEFKVRKNSTKPQQKPEPQTSACVLLSRRSINPSRVIMGCVVGSKQVSRFLSFRKISFFAKVEGIREREKWNMEDQLEDWV